MPKPIKYFTLIDKTDPEFPWFSEGPHTGWISIKKLRARRATRKGIRALKKEVIEVYGGSPTIMKVTQSRMKPIWFIRRKTDNFHYGPGRVIGGHAWTLSKAHAWEVREEAWALIRELRSVYSGVKIVAVKVL